LTITIIFHSSTFKVFNLWSSNRQWRYVLRRIFATCEIICNYPGIFKRMQSMIHACQMGDTLNIRYN